MTLLCANKILFFKEASVLKQAKPNTIATNVSTIPDTALEALARCLLPAIRSYFESDEGQREFAKWKVGEELQQEQKQPQLPRQQRQGIEILPSGEVELEQPLRLAG